MSGGRGGWLPTHCSPAPPSHSWCCPGGPGTQRVAGASRRKPPSEEDLTRGTARGGGCRSATSVPSSSLGSTRGHRHPEQRKVEQWGVGGSVGPWGGARSPGPLQVRPEVLPWGGGGSHGCGCCWAGPEWPCRHPKEGESGLFGKKEHPTCLLHRNLWWAGPRGPWWGEARNRQKPCGGLRWPAFSREES